MDGDNDTLSRALAAKETQRRRLRQLPFPEKVKVVIQLQKIAAPILAARGRKVLVWAEDDPPTPAPVATPATKKPANHAVSKAVPAQ